jgi:hypothetical protein
VHGASRAGFSFRGIDGVAVLSGCSPFTPAGPSPAPGASPRSYPAASDITWGQLSVGDVSGSPWYLSDDFTGLAWGGCGLPAALRPPGGWPPPTGTASGVNFNGWMHEIGHQLQQKDGIDIGGRWNGHPGGYSSGFDLMDSCYPCHESWYGLSGPPVMTGSKQVFNGWLPVEKVVDVPSLRTGPPVETSYVVAPLAQNFADTASPQGIKIDIAPGTYYLVDVRTSLLADSHNTGPGLWDEGVQIQRINESGDPPVTDIDACDTTVVGGCDRNGDRTSPTYDARTPNCSPAGVLVHSHLDVPDYCWPFRLWQSGQTFNDTANNIQIRVGDATFSGLTRSYTIAVRRGPAPGHPDLYITPWLTSPMNTYETVDIWVDSSCNGYEDDVGASGLRYGRRADGTVIGNGDDPCANHHNRIYAVVHNGGDAPAPDVHVQFYATNPLGVGVRGDTGWDLVGTADSSRFPSLSMLAPGARATVWVDWVPRVHLTDDQIRQEHFNFHSCVQVRILPAPGELNTANNVAQENFDNFEARVDRISLEPLNIPIRYIFLNNVLINPSNQKGFEDPGERLRREFFFDVKSELPPDWQYLVGGGEPFVTLAPGEVRQIPVKVTAARAPIASSYLLKVRARTVKTLGNAAISPRSKLFSRTHDVLGEVAGVVMQAQVVLTDDLTLAAELDSSGDIFARGALSPAHKGALVAIDYIDPGGSFTTRLASVAVDGSYGDRYHPSGLSGAWTVRAFWQGDRDHSSALALPVTVSVFVVPPLTHQVPQPTPMATVKQALPPIPTVPKPTLPPAPQIFKVFPQPTSVYYGQCSQSYAMAFEVQAGTSSQAGIASASLLYRYRSAKGVPGSWHTLSMQTKDGVTFFATVDVSKEAYGELQGGTGFVDYWVSVLDKNSQKASNTVQSVPIAYCPG